MAADRVGLNEVQDLARARPDELGPRRNRLEDLERLAHDRQRLDAGVRDAPGEHRDAAGSAVPERVGDHIDLAGVIRAVTLTLIPASDSSRTSGASDSPVDVVTGNLHVDVASPRRDHARLPADVVHVVGDDLERDRLVGDPLEKALRELGVVRQARLPHQARDSS